MPSRSTSGAPFDLATVDRLLTTTRAVRRRLDLDRAVPLGIVVECLRLAVQAPTGSNAQTWRWLVVTDPQVRRQLAELYRNPGATADPGATAGDGGGADVPSPAAPAPEAAPAPDAASHRRMLASADHLRRNLDRVPVLVVPCVQAVGGAAGWAPSIYPAVWSFMLALRSRGLGSVITTVHLWRREEADRLLGVPEGFVQACLVPVAFTVGTDFAPADRRPIEEVAYLDHWGRPLP
jgi:nitroreductase